MIWLLRFVVIAVIYEDGDNFRINLKKIYGN